MSCARVFYIHGQIFIAFEQTGAPWQLLEYTNVYQPPHKNMPQLMMAVDDACCFLMIIYTINTEFLLANY